MPVGDDQQPVVEVHGQSSASIEMEPIRTSDIRAECFSLPFRIEVDGRRDPRPFVISKSSGTTRMDKSPAIGCTQDESARPRFVGAPFWQWDLPLRIRNRNVLRPTTIVYGNEPRVFD